MLGIEFYDKFRDRLIDEKDLKQSRLDEMNEKREEKITKNSMVQTVSLTENVTIYHIPSKHI